MSEHTSGSGRLPRLDPQHPLNEAARIVNAYAEEQGIDATLEWLKMDVSIGAFAYFADQRSLRAIFARRGINLNPTTLGTVNLTADELALLSTLVSAYMDGIAIGWKAAQLAAKGAE